MERLRAQNPEFLTKKVNTGTNAVGVCLWFFYVLVEISCIRSIFTLLAEDNLESAIISVIFSVTLLYLPVRKIIRVLYSRKAVQISNDLKHVLANDVSAAQFKQFVSVPAPIETLKTLVEKGYLQDISYDQVSDRVYFSCRNFQEKQVTFSCPSCGASGSLEPWEKKLCPYCGSAVE